VVRISTGEPDKNRPLGYCEIGHWTLNARGELVVRNEDGKLLREHRLEPGQDPGAMAAKLLRAWWSADRKSDFGRVLPVRQRRLDGLTNKTPLVERRQLKMILRSIRLALRTLCGRRGQQQRAIESMAQAKGGLHVSPQIGDNHLLIQNFAVRHPGSIGRQSDVDNSIREPKCRCYLIKDEGGMRDVANRNYESLWGARVGVVCHDGSCRFWEWDSETACFVPLSLSSR